MGARVKWAFQACPIWRSMESVEEACAHAAVERERHLRALAYAVISFALASAGYFWFGFDRAHAVGYCITAFVALVLLNRRTMLGRVDEAPVQRAKER